MAAPTSKNEVTSRRLSDTVSGLWGKVKDTFSKKADSVYYVVGTTDYAAWAANTAYALNDNVVYSGKAYYCKTAHTSGSTWDSSKWTAIATPVLKGTINGITALDTGMKIAYKMPITGGATSTYLNINGLGDVYIRRNTGHTTTQLVAKAVVFLAYDGSAWKWADYDANTTYSGIITAFLNNAGDTAKTATCTNFKLTTGVTMLLTNSKANTKAAALTLNVNSTGAKNLYINGSASSSSNYTIPAGTFWIHYDGTYWQLYTDGRLPVKELKLTTALSVAQGGTGATDASTARTNLGAAASSHTHGNITNDGKVGTTADLPLKTTTGGAVAAGAWAASASDTGSSSSAGTATTFSRGDHTHKVSVATGDSAGQVKIAGQNASVNGWASKANDSSVVHLSGNETITGIKTFNNDMSPRQAHTATVKQSKAFTCSAITLYEDWDASQKDGNHFRAWTIDLTSTIVTASTHATIVVKMIGSYYYTPSNGSLQKEITFQIYNGNIVVSASDYTVAQSPCADEFKISGIFKSGSSYLVQVVNSKPTKNNYPLVLEIEMLSRNTSTVLDNVTMTGSIISGWPSWAGDINTPAKVTASGYPVLTDHGLMNTNGLNISRRLAAGSSNTSTDSDGSTLVIQSVNRDTYFGFLPAENVPVGANVAISFDVEYSGSDDGQFSWEFRFQQQVAGTSSIYIKGSGHYSGVCTIVNALIKGTPQTSFFDDTVRPSTMPQAAITIKNFKAEVGPIVTGYSKPLADVAFSGAYSDLSGKPTLGTAASKSIVTAWSGTPSDANVPSEKLVYDSMRQAPYALAHYHSEANTTRWVCLAKVYVPVTLSSYAGEMFAMSFRDSGADDIQGVLCVTNSEYGNANSVCAKFIVLGLRNTLYQSKVYILKESDSTYYIYSRLPANACAKITPILLHGTITYPNTYTTTEPSGLVNVPLVKIPDFDVEILDSPLATYETGKIYLL